MKEIEMRENCRIINGCTYKSTDISAAHYQLQQNLIQNKCSDMASLVNGLICKLSNLQIHEY